MERSTSRGPFRLRLSVLCLVCVFLLAKTIVEGFVENPFSWPYSNSPKQSSGFSDATLQVRTDESVEHDNGRNPSALEEPRENQRRSFLRSAVLTMAAGVASSTQLPSSAVADSTKYLLPTPAMTNELSWPIGKVAFSLLPLAGTSTRRATIEECVVPDTIWTHDQIQGVVNVNVPVRQTVVRLSKESGGGLWIHNPVAPTPQLLQMMKRLESQYGPVRHIVLGTVALEHKATLGAFASHFPEATVWLQPGQWAFPVNLPIEFFGLQQRGPRLREIAVPDKQPAIGYRYFAERDPVPEWSADFDYEVLGPLKFQSVGGFSETAFFHKSSKSLIVTDTVGSITRTPPAIIQEDPRALLYHARDSALERVKDTSETRQKGWRRMVQFGLVFFPSQIQVSTVSQALQEAGEVPEELRNLGKGGVPGTLYPWTWNGDSDIRSFEAISRNGKLTCPPILTKLILDREPERTLKWVNKVSTRFKDMKRVIPGHLNNNVEVQGSNEFSAAFDPLRSRPGNLFPQRALAEDLALLQKASDVLTTYGIVAPSEVCDGEPARKKGRFASVSS